MKLNNHEGFIGVDLATENARATLLYGDVRGDGPNGQKSHTESAPLATVIRPTSRKSEQDPNSWVAAVSSVLTRTSRFARDNSVEIRGICVSSTSGTVVAIDERLRFHSPAIMYDDSRASDPISRLCIALADSQPSKNSLALSHASDSINRWLTGGNDAPTDWSHALKSGFDLNNKCWSAKAQSIASEQSLVLPLVAPPGLDIGSISQEVADATGLPPATRVYLGMTDGCTSHVAAGAMTLESATTTVGTTLVTKVVCDSNIAGEGFYSHLLPLDTWLCGGASNLGAGAFKSRAIGVSLSDLDSQAEQFGPASFVTYPLTGHSERFPFTRNEISAFSTGSSDDAVENHRAILEGLAFAERLSYEILAEAGATSCGPIYTGGGASKSSAWCQIRSDVLGLPVFATKDATSGTGAALIAWAASQTSDLSHALSERVIDGTTYEPRLQEAEQLLSSYDRFLAELRVLGWLG